MKGKKRIGESGISSVVVMMLLIILMLYTIVGSSLVSQDAEETGMVANAEQSLFLAESGLQMAWYTLRDNWSQWNDPNTFPSRTLGTGSYTITVTDDNDGDNDSDVDSNQTLVVTVQGSEGGANRFIRALLNQSNPTLGDAIYTTQTLNTSGNVSITGGITENATFFPGIDLASAISMAMANSDNGYGSRADGNYFQGDFPNGQAPDSLNGVIVVDRFSNGNPASVNISGNASTTAEDPALLIIIGGFNVSGTIAFDGLIYVDGPINYQVAASGNVSINGSMIANTTINMSGNVDVVYDEDSAFNGLTLSLLEGGPPAMANWEEIFP